MFFELKKNVFYIISQICLQPFVQNCSYKTKYTVLNIQAFIIWQPHVISLLLSNEIAVNDHVASNESPAYDNCDLMELRLYEGCLEILIISVEFLEQFLFANESAIQFSLGSNLIQRKNERKRLMYFSLISFSLKFLFIQSLK